MPNLMFLPLGKDIEVTENTKVLVAARRAAVPLRYGCASCRCGTCAVEVSGTGTLSAIADNEKELLEKMRLPVDGSIRLACQARVDTGSLTIDIGFQDKYDPDSGLD